MYLLYLDESGTPEKKSEHYFVIGGAAVYERRSFWISGNIDVVQKRYFPDEVGPVEFHAAEIRAARTSPWRDMTRETREELLQELYGILRAERYPGFVAFAVAADKELFNRDSEAIYRRALEEITRRFDLFLDRREFREGDIDHRGLLIFDRSRFETRIRSLTAEYRTSGTQWGKLKRLADVPFFADSRATRMIQVADWIAYAVYRRYEFGDSKYLDMILPRFDSSDSVLHGLVHLTRSYRECFCPACMTRRQSPTTAEP